MTALAGAALLTAGQTISAGLGWTLTGASVHLQPAAEEKVSDAALVT